MSVNVYIYMSARTPIYSSIHGPSLLWLKNTLTVSLQRVKTFHQRLPGHGTKQSDCEASLSLEFCRIRSIPSLPSLPCPF